MSKAHEVKNLLIQAETCNTDSDMNGFKNFLLSELTKEKANLLKEKQL